MRAKNTQEILLKTATTLFAQKGYPDTSIRDIGARASISSSIIYHYFKNKEEILFTIIYNESQDLIKTLLEIEGRISDPVKCLREMLKEQSIIYSLKGKKVGKILAFDSHQLRGKRGEIIRKLQYDIYDIYKTKIQEIKDKKLLRDDIDLTVLTFSIFGIINSFHGWYKNSGRLSEEEVAENMERFLFNGILK
ncbi:MAG: TetR/AcrR family transcriptional regulator [Proteobacteria bacterium]|nr:TetR/AcrR family transcriptional regulator [Pseudomonadota bacterium]